MPIARASSLAARLAVTAADTHGRGSNESPGGSITRNPYGWKGPCYLLTDGIFPTYDALLDGMEWEDYGPGNDPRCEHCAIHSGFEPSAAYEAAGSLREGARSMAWTLTG